MKLHILLVRRRTQKAVQVYLDNRRLIWIPCFALLTPNLEPGMRDLEVQLKSCSFTKEFEREEWKREMKEGRYA